MMTIGSWLIPVSACLAGMLPLFYLAYSRHKENIEKKSKKLSDDFDEEFSEWFGKKVFIRDVMGYAVCVKGSSGMARIDGVWRIYSTEDQAYECITSDLAVSNPGVSLEVRAVNMTYNFK